MSDFVLSPITAADALSFSRWRYGPGFGMYDMADEDAQGLLPPALRYHGVRRNGALWGFACFGKDAQVLGGPYGQAALDMGCGLDPALCGQGHGLAFVQAIAAFAQEQFASPRLRLTVAADNRRAIIVYERAGFTATARFPGMVRGGIHRFVVMELSPLLR